MQKTVLYENIEKQLEEIEIIKSIYSNPNEFSLEDPDAVEDAIEFVNKFKSIESDSFSLSKTISFIIKIGVDVEKSSAKDIELDDGEKVT